MHKYKYPSWCIAIFLTIVLKLAQCQEEQSFNNNNCLEQDVCDSCVSRSPYCKWCSDPKFGNITRCQLLERLETYGCPKESIITHKKSFVSKIKDEPQSDISNDLKTRPVQIRPQEVSLGLLPFETQTFTFNYRQAMNYPLDLYYLMDLTYTMTDDKTTLAGLGSDLISALKNMTADFRLGFGSYAEKPIMPYTRMDEKYRANPCRQIEKDQVCEPTTTYRHRLNLTEDVLEFSKIVNNSKITGNLDNAEAGLEALMQILVCGKKVGWRPTSRKIVVFATDNVLHFSGDGKLGGAVVPNDRKCHLDDNGTYLDNLNMDYPSLEQIYRELLKQKISIIFAVTSDVKPYYERMTRLLPENIFVAALSEDSSNILNLVKKGYESLVRVIKFQDDSDDNIKLTYFSNCAGADELVHETARCNKVQIGETYSFKVDVTLDKCPVDAIDMNKKITISEVQSGQDSLVINVKLLCDCDCSKVKPVGAENCPKNSKWKCGKCVCEKGWKGTNCDCDIRTANSQNSTANCRAPNKVQPCSGYGECLCDSCVCDPGNAGQYCECKACPISSENGQPCGGNSRGNCDCGSCICNRNWFGPTCSCSKTHCIAPWDNLECSGRGSCDCVSCNCREVNGIKYSGKYCEQCYNCTNPACALYNPCAECLADPVLCTDTSCAANGTLYQECMADDEICNIEDDLKFCEHVINDTCTLSYRYIIQKDWIVKLKMDRSMCEGQYIFVTAGFRNIFGGIDRIYAGIAIVVFILVSGIAAIALWKFCEYWRFRVEYKQFLAEQVEQEYLAKMGEANNPLYRSPLSEFKVPDAYKKLFEEQTEL